MEVHGNEPCVKRENYINLQGWMLTDLKLKGNELIIYACIYGFSQTENQVFNGRLQYLAEWTNSTKQCVIKCLKSLVEKGLIEKTDKIVNGIKFCEYHAKKFNGTMQKSLMSHETIFNGGIKKSLTSDNIGYNNTSDNIGSIVKDIVDFLNQRADCRYKADTPKTVSLIKARMAEGFTVEDFKTVINHMVAEWKGTDMEKFLRPETLFGTKFESYLNRKPKQNNSQPAQKQEWGYDFLKGVTVIR